jgi:hypothetical protein
MLRKIHSLRPVPFPSLSLSSSAKNSIDVSISSKNEIPMLRFVAAPKIKSQPADLVPHVISKQKNFFLFNTFICLDETIISSPSSSSSTSSSSSASVWSTVINEIHPPLKKKDGLRFPTLECSQSQKRQNENNKYSNSLDQNNNNKNNDNNNKIWFDILPLPYFSQSSSAIEKNSNFFLPEFENPYSFTFRDQEEGSNKKVICFPTPVALRERSSGIVLVSGVNSCCQVFSFPHLNLPLLFLPCPPPANLFSASTSIVTQENGTTKIQERSSVSEHHQHHHHAPTQDFLYKINRHLILVDMTAERILNQFFSSNENLKNYSGKTKLVCVSNSSFGIHQKNQIEESEQESRLPSSAMLDDGFEALRQVRVICAALQEGTQFIKSEIKNSEEAIRSTLTQEIGTTKATNFNKRNHHTAALSSEEQAQIELLVQDRLLNETKALWEHCFCRVLDAHIREQGSVVSLLDVLQMKRRPSHLIDDEDQKNSDLIMFANLISAWTKF